MKYVMFRRRSKGPVKLTSFFPVLFPESETHSQIADAILSSMNVQAVSAGFVGYRKGVMECHGKSTSCKLGAHADDSAIMEFGGVMSFCFDERKGCKTYGN